MSETQEQPAAWAVLAAERAPSVERSRQRSVARAQQVVQAARGLVAERGGEWTTQELVKAAGIAVQTLYKYFPSKDHVLIAVLEDMVTEAVALLDENMLGIDDPVERLHLFIAGILGRLGEVGQARHGSHFVAAERWRLARLYPEDLRRVDLPAELFVQRQLEAAVVTGQLRPNDPAADAQLTTQLLLAVFHTYAFAGLDDVDTAVEQIWQFLLNAWRASDAVRQRHVA